MNAFMMGSAASKRVKSSVSKVFEEEMVGTV